MARLLKCRPYCSFSFFSRLYFYFFSSIWRSSSSNSIFLVSILSFYFYNFNSFSNLVFSSMVLKYFLWSYSFFLICSAWYWNTAAAIPDYKPTVDEEPFGWPSSGPTEVELTEFNCFAKRSFFWFSAWVSKCLLYLAFFFYNSMSNNYFFSISLCLIFSCSIQIYSNLCWSKSSFSF